MRIQCSRCGIAKDFRYSVNGVNKSISEGWRSYGSALYCPECSKTWHERNKKEIGTIENTINVIDHIYCGRWLHTEGEELP